MIAYDGVPSAVASLLVWVAVFRSREGIDMISKWASRIGFDECQDFRRISAWAMRVNQVVTLFDIETTGYPIHSTQCGITEIATFHFLPSGACYSAQSLINPENPIHWAAKKINDIREEDVERQPVWGLCWAYFMRFVAEEHLSVGYCSARYDCPVIIRQNQRYGLTGTAFRKHLDVFSLLGKSGRLSDVAAGYGIGCNEKLSHRAHYDAWILGAILNSVVDEKRASMTDWFSVIDCVPSSPKERREELKRMLQARETIDYASLAKRFRVAGGTIESDLEKLFLEKEVPFELISDEVKQAWLIDHMDEIIGEVWNGEATGRLKPLKERIDREAPFEVDYLQLRLCLIRKGRCVPR